MRQCDVRTTEPTEELLQKIRRAREEIVTKKSRDIKCPYCLHKLMVVYEDCTGHFEAKCSKCGRITVIDAASMLRMRSRDKKRKLNTTAS